MRPVNLIPPDMRRGDSAPLRTGPLAYIVLGALALVLVGVTMLVLTSNEVAEKKDELVTLRQEELPVLLRPEAGGIPAHPALHGVVELALEVQHGGLGLVGMQERMALLNGELATGPRTDSVGFRVIAHLPIDA